MSEGTPKLWEFCLNPTYGRFLFVNLSHRGVFCSLPSSGNSVQSL
jgi:hypothetical protein